MHIFGEELKKSLSCQAKADRSLTQESEPDTTSLFNSLKTRV